MNGSSSSRWLAWTGPLFFLVFVVAVFVLEGETPEGDASAEKVMAYYNSHETRALISVFLSPAACALLILFASHVRARARQLGSAAAGPTVMVGGAIVWASGLLLGSMLQLALLDASDNGQAQAAEAANVISAAAWLPFIAGIAITLIGAGMTVLSTGLLPKWLGWVALVIGVIALIGPGGFAGFFVGPIWLLVAGVLLSRSHSSTEPAAKAT